MAKVFIKNVDFETARKRLAGRGIVLTKRKTRDGGYFCYAGKGIRKMLEILEK